MTAWLLRRTRATPHELAAVLRSFVYFFALLAGYYVLRPIRDEMGGKLGALTGPLITVGLVKVLVQCFVLFGA